MVAHRISFRGGLRILERIYPHTAFAAVLHASGAAARTIHDASTGRGSISHLFRLPIPREREIRTLLLATHGQRLTEELRPALGDRDALIEPLCALAAEDLLGRYTAYRARDVVRRVFARRFLIPSDRPARMLKGIVDRGLPRKTFTEMLFLFACRADDLLYDFTIQSYWEAVQRGRTRLTAADALAFFADTLSRGCSGQVKTDTQLSSMGEILECIGTEIPQI